MYGPKFNCHSAPQMHPIFFSSPFTSQLLYMGDVYILAFVLVIANRQTLNSTAVEVEVGQDRRECSGRQGVGICGGGGGGRGQSRGFG